MDKINDICLNIKNEIEKIKQYRKYTDILEISLDSFMDVVRKETFVCKCVQFSINDPEIIDKIYFSCKCMDNFKISFGANRLCIATDNSQIYTCGYNFNG